MKRALRHHGDKFYTKKNSIKKKSTGIFKGKDNAVPTLYKLLVLLKGLLLQAFLVFVLYHKKSLVFAK